MMFPALLLASLAAGADAPPASIDEAVRRVYPALVRLHVVTIHHGDGREVKSESVGSGVIVSAEGHVVTNHHVAGQARRIQVTLQNREQLPATLVGTDALADIAVVKLDLGGRKEALPVAAWGDSGTLQVGQPVFAMGSPLAISQSVTRGIVSNLEMTFPQFLGGRGFELSGENVGSLVKWIGHDAEIFPGNSGGPLVNERGEVVGINEISYGLAGAIPGNLAKEVVAELIAHGEVRRSWLGLGLQPLLKSSTETGVLVASITPKSPAAEAKLQPGDVLISYDGQTLDVRHPEQMPAVNRLMLSTPIGKTVALRIRREGQERTVKLATVARGLAEGHEAELSTWGVAVQDLPLLQAREMGREPLSGVLVTSVRAGSPAAEAKPALSAGDTIVSVGGRPVRRVDELLAASEKGGATLLVTFERGPESLLTVVRPEEDRARDRSAEATKSWVPASTQVLTRDVAEALGLAGRTGVRVTHIPAGSSAEKAGLKVGDVILKVDDDLIAASQPEEVEVFPAMVRQYRVGTTVTLSVVREGKELALPVVLEPSPRRPREMPEYRDRNFDFTARDLTLQDRLRDLKAFEGNGALVTSVQSGGWAALGRLSVGDVVLSVDGQPVGGASDLESLLRKAAGARQPRVVLLVRRGMHTLFLEIEPAWAS